MENVIVQRKFVPLMEEKDFYAMAEDAMGCLDLYRAQWQESFLAEDGSCLVCRFQAPDSESIRMMSRGDGAVEKRVWAGSVHDTEDDGLATVVVERSFNEPASMDELQSREDAAASCLELHRVSFIRSIFSADKKKMVCLYRAPDAESVRLAQEQADMPVDRVWACRHYTPENIFS